MSRSETTPPVTGTSDPGSAAASLERLRIDRAALSRRRRLPVGWIILGVLLLGGGAAIFASKREEWSAPHVEVVKARRITATQGAVETTANGVIVARRKAAISSKLSGRLDEILVDVGDRVTEGQILGRLGHDDLDAAVAQARADIEVKRRQTDAARADANSALAAVAAAEAKLPEMESMEREMTTRLTDADRVLAMQDRMASSGAASKDGVDAARTARAVAADQLERTRRQTASLRAEIARQRAAADAAAAHARTAEAMIPVAEAALNQAEALRRDADIVAPFAGRVIRKEAEVGEMVSPVNAAGSTTRGAVVTLVDFASLEMEVDVIERDIAKVHEGAPCRIVLDARRESPYAGVVRQKVPTADRAKQTVLVKVAFTALDDFVTPEMGGRVEFLAAGKGDRALAKDRVLAPAGAFTTRDGKSGVFVITDGRVKFTPAENGGPASGDGSLPGDATAATGLAGGEELVLDPSPELTDGALVKPKTPAPAK